MTNNCPVNHTQPNQLQMLLSAQQHYVITITNTFYFKLLQNVTAANKSGKNNN